MDVHRQALHRLEGKDGVLRALAFGHPPRGSRSEIERALSRAAALARDGKLLPPAEAAFLEKPRVGIDSSDGLGPATLRLLESQPSRASDLSGGEGEDKLVPYVAFRYAEALLRQEEVLEALSRVNELNAPVQAGLPDADRARLEEYLLFRNVRGRFETLDSLVGQWGRAVASLKARPDAWVADVYADWLHTRDSLEHALSVLSPETRNGIEGAVRGCDEAFLALTRTRATPFSTASPWRLRRWWWFREPAERSSE
jgi:hypothetical protein